MAQTLFMVLVDTTEATSQEMLDKLKKFLEDAFSNFATSAVSSITDVDGADDSDSMDRMADELADLQFKIEQTKN